MIRRSAALFDAPPVTRMRRNASFCQALCSRIERICDSSSARTRSSAGALAQSKPYSAPGSSTSGVDSGTKYGSSRCSLSGTGVTRSNAS